MRILDEAKFRRWYRAQTGEMLIAVAEKFYQGEAYLAKKEELQRRQVWNPQDHGLPKFRLVDLATIAKFQVSEEEHYRILEDHRKAAQIRKDFNKRQKKEKKRRRKERKNREKKVEASLRSLKEVEAAIKKREEERKRAEEAAQKAKDEETQRAIQQRILELHSQLDTLLQEKADMESREEEEKTKAVVREMVRPYVPTPIVVLEARKAEAARQVEESTEGGLQVSVSADEDIRVTVPGEHSRTRDEVMAERRKSLPQYEPHPLLQQWARSSDSRDTRDEEFAESEREAQRQQRHHSRQTARSSDRGRQLESSRVGGQGRSPAARSGSSGSKGRKKPASPRVASKSPAGGKAPKEVKRDDGREKGPKKTGQAQGPKKGGSQQMPPPAPPSSGRSGDRLLGTAPFSAGPSRIPRPEQPAVRGPSPGKRGGPSGVPMLPLPGQEFVRLGTPLKASPVAQTSSTLRKDAASFTPRLTVPRPTTVAPAPTVTSAPITSTTITLSQVTVAATGTTASMMGLPASTWSMPPPPPPPLPVAPPPAPAATTIPASSAPGNQPQYPQSGYALPYGTPAGPSMQPVPQGRPQLTTRTLRGEDIDGIVVNRNPNWAPLGLPRANVVMASGQVKTLVLNPCGHCTQEMQVRVLPWVDYSAPKFGSWDEAEAALRAPLVPQTLPAVGGQQPPPQPPPGAGAAFQPSVHWQSLAGQPPLPSYPPGALFQWPGPHSL